MIGPMREVTQRRIVRCAFLLLCLTPVLATLGWSVVWALPTHTRRIERQIRRQIGVSVSIGLSEHPRPQQLRLSDLQLRDPETDRPLGRINQLTLQHSENTTKLEVDELILVSDQRERLWNCVHDAILGQAVLENKQVQFNIRSVLLVNQSNPFEQHLYDVSGQAWSADNSVAANLAFQLNPPTSSPHLEVTLKRNQTVWGGTSISYTNLMSSDAVVGFANTLNVLALDTQNTIVFPRLPSLHLP